MKHVYESSRDDPDDPDDDDDDDADDDDDDDIDIIKGSLRNTGQETMIITCSF